MRPHLLVLFLTCLSLTAIAQTKAPSRKAGQAKPVIFSASSDWQKVTFKSTTRPRSAEVVSSSAPPERMTRPSLPSPTQSEVVGRTGPTATPASQPASTPVLPPTTAGLSPEPAAPSSTKAKPAPASRSTPPAPNAVGYRPAFTGDFVTNRNGWQAGNKGDYNYQIGVGKYNVRKRNVNTNQVAFSYVPLPAEINLNVAETFTIKVDVVADSGRVPTGGVLFGVADSLNYCAFTLNSKGEISIVRVANGATSSDYMPGDFFRPGVLLEKNRDRLIIRRTGDLLHFYINEQEVRSSPYPFKMLPGNGIGLTTTGYWTSFQKLTVTLGP